MQLPAKITNKKKQTVSALLAGLPRQKPELCRIRPKENLSLIHKTKYYGKEEIKKAKNQ